MPAPDRYVDHQPKTRTPRRSLRRFLARDQIRRLSADRGPRLETPSESGLMVGSFRYGTDAAFSTRPIVGRRRAAFFCERGRDDGQASERQEAQGAAGGSEAKGTRVDRAASVALIKVIFHFLQFARGFGWLGLLLIHVRC